MMKKVFNWSELHLSPVTSYKIHTLVPILELENDFNLIKMPTVDNKRCFLVWPARELLSALPWLTLASQNGKTKDKSQATETENGKLCYCKPTGIFVVSL